MKAIYLFLIIGVAALADPQLPQTAEIIELLKSHFVDKDKLDQRTLDEATVAGLLDRLGPGAKLLSAEEAAANPVPVIISTADPAEPLARVEIIEPDIAYIRVADVVAATATDLDIELEKFAEARVIGYILDLRFANGTDYEAAAAVASRFLPAGRELFSLKQAQTDAKQYRTAGAPRVFQKAPLLLLVNGQTRGSAEVLAAALRAQERGIVIGAPTAGLAVAWEDVPLSGGQVLRVATAKFSFPAGSEVFPGGLVPDILVRMDSRQEREAIFNVETNMTLTASLQPRITKRTYNEAELVRAFRGEALSIPTRALRRELTLSGDAEAGDEGGATEGEINQVRDSVLQRAVDILKGIRVLISWQ